MIAPLLLSPPPVEYRIDFAKHAGVPLLKTKFGVYETPFVKQDELVRSLALIHEIGVHDLRYELAWGKPDAVERDMVRADGIDFGFVDAVLGRCRQLGIRPLLANSYCPTFLQTRTDWPAWKDVPKDLDAWRAINQAFVAHLKGQNIRYEVWNEPDMPEGSGKTFFSGGVEDYGRVYRSATEGLRSGDPDAQIGGPAIAYDLRYLAPVLAGTADFASIHGYANYPVQIANLRKALAARPDLPILLTEYASFNDFRKDGPAVRSNAAAAFFRDADGLLKLTDVTTVYWAQWIDDYLGLVGRDGHRHALFNAFKLYGAMPTDRVAVDPPNDAQTGLTILASASKTEAAIVAANPTDHDQTVTLRFNRRGTWRLQRIDPHHASYVDDPSTELLKVDETLPSPDHWTGIIPAQGVVALQTGKPERTPTPPKAAFIRTHHSFPDRNSPAYADFDPATWTLRLGGAPAQIGVELDGLKRLKTTQIFGPHPTIRLQFRTQAGTWSPSQNPGNTIDLPKLAPQDWDGHRIRLNFTNDGPSPVKLILSGALATR